MRPYERLNAIAGRIDAHKYLEIGVYRAVNLCKVNVRRKAGVDVKFLLDPSTKETLRTQDCDLFETSSDEFFANLNSEEKFDLIFIDGLHTFEQVCRDLLNSINHLSSGGVIIIDDTFPTSLAASQPDMDRAKAIRKVQSCYTEAEKLSNAWMGDVYKVLFFVDKMLPSFTMLHFKEGHRQTMLIPRKRKVGNSIENILQLSSIGYDDFILSGYFDQLKLSDQEVLDYAFPASGNQISDSGAR